MSPIQKLSSAIEADSADLHSFDAQLNETSDPDHIRRLNRSMAAAIARIDANVAALAALHSNRIEDWQAKARVLGLQADHNEVVGEVWALALSLARDVADADAKGNDILEV
jgi:hypothetical protein